MDAVTSLLDGPRARRAFLLRSVLTPPWAFDVRDEAPLTVVAMVRGDAWVIPHDAVEPHQMREGDVAIVQGPGHYRVADAVDTATQVVVHPGQRCASPDGSVVYALADLGVRTWGNDPDGPVVMVTGTYPTRSEVGRRLLDALPVVVVAPPDDTVRSLIAVLAAEVGHDAAGQESMLDRILDLLLVAAVRSWFLRPDVDTPGWYAAYSDPVVGVALQKIHRDIARPWTVDRLAHECGVARATIARRFTALVGEPPMAYLTTLRLDTAADLLLEPDSTLESVARRVGYGTAFSLSAAFRRVRGMTPHEHRSRAARPLDVVAQRSLEST